MLCTTADAAAQYRFAAHHRDGTSRMSEISSSHIAAQRDHCRLVGLPALMLSVRSSSNIHDNALA